ncbi:MAG: IS66 family transposase [Halothiobacillus sp.]
MQDLFAETFDANVAAIENALAANQPADADNTDAAVTQRPATQTGRKSLPAHLPRVEIVHEPDTRTCGECGGQRQQIEADVREILNVIPAKFFVERHIYPKYACRACQTLIMAPAMPNVIDGGLAAPRLLAWVGVSKHTDHLPLYRIAQIAERQGVKLSRSTPAQWIGRLGVALQPLVDCLTERLLQATSLHADETPVGQLNPANGSGTAKAIDYSLKRWAALSRYAETGHLPLDNNPVENAIRSIALGRKNWLFAGSERAGKRAAAIQSLLATAKLNHLDPYAWLKDIFDKLPTWPNSRIDELLPLRGHHTQKSELNQ